MTAMTVVSSEPRPTTRCDGCPPGAPPAGDNHTVAHTPAAGDLLSPALPVRFPIAASFAAAPDTTL